MEKAGFFEGRERDFEERPYRRRISNVYETDDYHMVNNKLHNGWDLFKAIISNGKSFYILVKYGEQQEG